MNFFFYFFSFIALLSAVSVISSNKPTRALLSLIVTMFALSVLYLLLGATFLAMVHLIVYAGAVLVLFLFVIMLQGIGAKEIPLASRFKMGYLILAVLTGTSFLVLTAALIGKSTLPNAGPVWGNVETIAQALFNQYLIPFELTSLLLLLGVFAAVSLAKKEEV